MFFNKTKFIIFTFVFVIFTIIGTLSHELGHLIVAKAVGFKDTELHYGSMKSDNLPLENEYIAFYKKNKYFIDNQLPYKEKETHLKNGKLIRQKHFLVTLGGPLQTILTGLIGLLILFFRRKKYPKKFTLLDWFAVFLSLFWLREIFILLTGFFFKIIDSKNKIFGGDEYYLSLRLHIWEGTISLFLGFIGFFISVFIVFKVIPKKLRFIFIVAGLLGGMLGFALWFGYLGPILLP